MPRSQMSDDEKEKLGEELRSLRQAAGVTQADVAEAADVHKTAVSHVENGNYASWQVIDAIIREAEAFDEVFRNNELQELVSKAVPNYIFQEFAQKASTSGSDAEEMRLRDAINELLQKTDSAEDTFHEMKNIANNINQTTDSLVEKQAEEGKFEGLNIASNLASTHDEATVIHNHNVSMLNRVIAEAMELDKDTIRLVEEGGLLHDIGKIGVHDTILEKPDDLTDEEYEEVKKHAETGWEAISNCGFTQYKPCVLYHHERLDGSGYPEGLEGDEIPLEARITAVSDIFDALTSRREYQDAIPVDKAVEELERQVNEGKIDPEITSVLVDLLAEKKIYKDNENGVVAINAEDEEFEGPFLAESDQYPS